VIGRRRIGRRLAMAGLALLALGLALSWLLGALMVRAQASAVARAEPPAQDIRIITRDGVQLAATYRPGDGDGGPAVLLLHGNGASRAATAGNAAWLAGQGFATLTIDFRGHGESSPRSHSFGLGESEDARAAFAWLKRRQRGAPVGVIGISLGGAAALLGREGPLPADALVLQAVYPDIRHAIRNRIASIVGTVPASVLEPLLSFQSRPRFGAWPAQMAPIAALPRYHGPVLVIGGTADRFTPPVETRAMFDAATGPRELWWARDDDHAATSDRRDPAYRSTVLRFLTAYLGAPPKDDRSGAR